MPDRPPEGADRWDGPCIGAVRLTSDSQADGEECAQRSTPLCEPVFGISRGAAVQSVGRTLLAAVRKDGQRLMWGETG